MFIDGRSLDGSFHTDYFAIAGASLRSVNGREEYLDLLDCYQIDFLVLKNRQLFATITLLFAQMLRHEDWLPDYYDELGCVLVRSQKKTI